VQISPWEICTGNGHHGISGASIDIATPKGVPAHSGCDVQIPVPEFPAAYAHKNAFAPSPRGSRLGAWQTPSRNFSISNAALLQTDVRRNAYPESPVKTL
jgi:hypothetical protein